MSSPLSAISSILSPVLITSSPAIISLSLQATAKIFGQHLSKISSLWSAEIHEQAKNLTLSVLDGFRPFLNHPDLEVQERASELSQLYGFVNADLQGHFPPPVASSSSTPVPDDIQGGFEDSNHKSNSNPPYPKSLFLLQPLFTSHELNTLAYKAQEAVRIPEGLNLDVDVVPGGGFADIEDDVLKDESEEEEMDLGIGGGKGMDELRRVLREQENRGKGKQKGKGKKKEDLGRPLSAEEKEEKDRVGSLFG